MNEETTPMTPLDQMVSGESLQLIKAAVPYLPQQGQRFLSLYAKFAEFRNTLALFSQPREMSAMSQPERQMLPPMELLDELARYSGGALRENVKNLQQTFSLALAMQEMSAQEMQGGENDERRMDE